MRLFVPVLALVACTSVPGTDSATTDTTDATEPTDTTEETKPPEPSVVSLTTTDDVTLAADWHPAAIVKGAPAFVLLHMIPPGNDRTNWPTSFVEQLTDEGWSVLVVDRRGAGDSKGDAVEAYEGPNGKLDVDAAVRFVAQQKAGDLVLIGASNGTTSMLDYTVWAEAEDKPTPVALGFMSGGAYTENQSSMSDLPALPSVFTYPPNESGWPAKHTKLDPGSWALLEYKGGAHGTRMFDVAPQVGQDLVDFFSGVLNPE